MMNQALDSNLFDYVNYPTVKCPIIAKPNVEQAVKHPMTAMQENEVPLQLSIQEPYYPVFRMGAVSGVSCCLCTIVS